MLLKLNISDINHHSVAVKQLLEFASNYKVIVFDAPMGSGKTTFIKTLCIELGVTDSMSSPTYSIVNEYHTIHQSKIYHFDLYRLTSSEELYDIGFEDYINSNNYTFIEWPELAYPFLTSYISVKIERDENNRYLYAEIIND